MKHWNAKLRRIHSIIKGRCPITSLPQFQNTNKHFGPNTDRVELTLRLGAVSTPVTEQGSESSVKSSVKIVQAMRDNAHITAAELALMLGISERAIYKNIAKLRDAGIIRRKGSDIAGEREVLK